MVDRMRFLILHGYEGSGPDHWQAWLVDHLRAAGHDVAFPELPDPTHPRLEPWLQVVSELRRADDVVICHSLACCLWLHHRARGGAPAQRALLEEIASFFPVPLEPEYATEARIVCSDDDPYCPRGAIDRFVEPLGTPVNVLPDAGHVNPEAGYGPWPAVLRWAQGENQGIET
jgi:predicted alpha/beta hydrolase family esterase